MKRSRIPLLAAVAAVTIVALLDFTFHIFGRFDIVGFVITFATVYGIYAILGISLNLEYGYAGQPNFGQVLFFGIGAVVGATAASEFLPIFVGKSVGDICTIPAELLRENIALTSPVASVSVWVIALLLAMVAGGVVGLLASYPALRVKEEWFLSMILLVGGETFRIIVQNTPQIGCGFNGVAGITTPFYWLSNYIGSSVLQSEVPTGLFAAVVVAIAFVCFVIAQRVGNSPYGRLMKSVRDDKTAAASLGKNVSNLRKQVMVLGSMMAGVAGALYVYYIGVASSDDFIPAVTFSVWVMMILGGYGNNRGILVGTFVITLLDRGTLISSSIIQGSFYGFDPSLIIYGRYMVEAVILLLLLAFRQKGIFPETRVKTKAYTLFDFKGKTAATEEQRPPSQRGPEP